MNKVIVTSEDELRAIIEDCLYNSSKIASSSPVSDSPEYIYSLKDLSTFLGCSIGTVQKLKNSGKIRYKQFGRKCVFNPMEVLEDINNRNNPR